MNKDRIKYFQSKTNGAVFDLDCNLLTELDDPDLYYYDRDSALWVCEFIETVGKVVEGGHNYQRGDKIKLLDWQVQTICNLFGVKQKKNGLRRYWYVLQLLPKKQGKSPFSALLGLYILCGDEQGRAQIFTVAGDKAQAKIIHDNAKQMVSLDKEFLAKNLVIRRDHIEHPPSGGTFWVTSAVEETKHGPNLSAIFNDEPHVQKTGDLDTTLLKGIAARPEPVVAYTSTAGVRHCWFHQTKYRYAKRLLDGEITDPRWLVFIYEADVMELEAKYGDTWENGAVPWWAREEVHKDVNPSYGVTVTKDYFDDQITLIKNNPDELNDFLRLHLNVFTGASVAWSITRNWAKNRGKVVFGDLRGKRCFGGLATFRPGDMVSMCLFFPDEPKKTFWWKVFATKESIYERIQHTKGFADWVRDGYIEEVDADYLSSDTMYELFWKYLEHVDCVDLIYPDNHGEAGQKLKDEKGIQAGSVSVKGNILVEATVNFQNWVNAGEINHGSNPVMGYQIGVTEIVKKDDNVKPSADLSRDNICCVFSTLFAVAAYLYHEPSFVSVYDKRPIRVL